MVMELLKPLKEATEATAKDKYPTLSKMMPFFDELLDHFQEFENNITLGNQRSNLTFLVNESNDDLVDATEGASKKLDEYFQVSSNLAIVATILDPRFKMEYYANTDSDKTTYSSHLEIFKTYYAQYSVPGLEVMTSETKQLSSLSFFRNKV